jgi:hypothetical protein
MGVIGKLMEKIGGKPTGGEDVIKRLGENKSREEPEPKQEEFMPRYKLAQKWREEQADKEPLVKRRDFKRRI